MRLVNADQVIEQINEAIDRLREENQAIADEEGICVYLKKNGGRIYGLEWAIEIIEDMAYEVGE